LKKKLNSSHKLSKQQSTSFWSQGILGVKATIWGVLGDNPTIILFCMKSFSNFI
jgi:hypothetical protein